MSVLPYPGGGGWVGGSGRISGWVGVQPPPPQGGVGLCGGPWVYRATSVKDLVFCIACLSWVRGWVGGWVSDPPPPPRGGGVGHLSVCGYAKILGGWVPELTPPPPPRVAKQNPACGGAAAVLAAPRFEPPTKKSMVACITIRPLPIPSLDVLPTAWKRVCH